MMSEPALKCENNAIPNQIVFLICLLLLKWPIIAVPAKEEI